MRRLALLSLLLAACASSLPTRPNDREWLRLLEEYRTIESYRAAAPDPVHAPSRGQQIDRFLEQHRALQARLGPLLEKLEEYAARTGDTRAARLVSNERIRMGDLYMLVLARYDRAIELYQSALAADPSNTAAQDRIAMAQARRFVSMDEFAKVRSGMSDQQVRALLGMPREDWIKHVRQGDRLYAVWIFPRHDGAAAAVYFDNGIVYHTNWNAAAPRQ